MDAKEEITFDEWKTLNKDEPKGFDWDGFVKDFAGKPTLFTDMYLEFQKRGGNHVTNLRRKVYELVRKKKAELRYKKKDGKIRAVVLIKKE